jgi:tetratricopeptide (TPR) repeat protein
VKQLFHQREVSRLIGISEGRIRHWERQGLVAPQERQKGDLWFDFPALVAFRTVKELRRQGVSLGRIKKCVARLQQLMPGMAQPLSAVRFSLAKKQLVCGKDRRRFTSEGQLLLDFTASESSIPHLRGEFAGSLFAQALADEAQGKGAEARQKYEAILAANPEEVNTLVNLGNLLYLAGDLDGAAHRYRQALGVNPDHAEANFNLANLMLEQDDLENAILFYRKALHEAPQFAEAHFNLAAVLGKTGAQEKARAHWLRYLELEPESQWADYIRKLLEE